MNIIINGYGRMGREIEQILIERGHSLCGTIDSGGYGDYIKLTEKFIKESQAEMVIEFASPDCVMDNGELCSRLGVAVVNGTTGWNENLGEMKELIEKSHSAYLYGSNFSIGAHMFFSFVEKAAAMINPLPEYDIFMIEHHHNKKKDSPSGTALTAANKVIENNIRKTSIVADPLNREIKEEELHVASLRGGSIPGTHTLMLDSLADTIEITHRARNRKGFALGAVLAAEWLVKKTGFYRIEDYMAELLKEK